MLPNDALLLVCATKGRVGDHMFKMIFMILISRCNWDMRNDLIDCGLC